MQLHLMLFLLQFSCALISMEPTYERIDSFEILSKPPVLTFDTFYHDMFCSAPALIMNDSEQVENIPDAYEVFSKYRIIKQHCPDIPLSPGAITLLKTQHQLNAKIQGLGLLSMNQAGNKDHDQIIHDDLITMGMAFNNPSEKSAIRAILSNFTRDLVIKGKQYMEAPVNEGGLFLRTFFLETILNRASMLTDIKNEEIAQQLYAYMKNTWLEEDFTELGRISYLAQENDISSITPLSADAQEIKHNLANALERARQDGCYNKLTKYPISFYTFLLEKPLSIKEYRSDLFILAHNRFKKIAAAYCDDQNAFSLAMKLIPQQSFGKKASICVQKSIVKNSLEHLIKIYPEVIDRDLQEGNYSLIKYVHALQKIGRGVPYIIDQTSLDIFKQNFEYLAQVSHYFNRLFTQCPLQLNSKAEEIRFQIYNLHKFLINDFKNKKNSDPHELTYITLLYRLLQKSIYLDNLYKYFDKDNNDISNAYKILSSHWQTTLSTELHIIDDMIKTHK